MESLTNLVAESLARHGFDRPLDYRRLRWSLWFRCDSHHSLLQVPSKPGVFAFAEEVMDLGSPLPEAESRKPEASTRRMLAVTHFFEADDMAFVLDRMLSQQNPLRASLLSGQYFVRFVVIEDETQRRSIATALNQWMASSAEKASGIGSHFATSLELTPATEYITRADGAQASLFEYPVGQTTVERTNVGRTFLSATANTTDKHLETSAQPTQSATIRPVSTSPSTATAPPLNSGAATNIHCPPPFPSGF